MCGIAGWFRVSDAPDTAVADALAALNHRGPDGVGVVTRGAVTLGMCRLSIIDLAGGMQPIYNETGSVAVVCNGELYNYQELTGRLQQDGHVFRTKSDVEVLPHLYEARGRTAVGELFGMFAFALHDAATGHLVLGRDRFGKKPLYYFTTRAGDLAFASELKAIRVLARALGHPLEVRDQGVYDYLSLGCIPQPETIYDGVHVVPPASTLTWDGRTATIERYWSLEGIEVRPRAWDDVLAELRSLVHDAVRIRLRSDVPIGVFLSGGIDSSVVAYEASTVLGAELATFTVAMQDAALDESAIAARTARAFGVKHEILPLAIDGATALPATVAAYDQPFYDSSAIATMAIARAARRHVTVALNGDGGDEMFAGYRHHVAAWWGDALRFVPRRFASGSAVLPGRFARRRGDASSFVERFWLGLAAGRGARHLLWTRNLLDERQKRDLWRGQPCRPTEEWIESAVPPRRRLLDEITDGVIRVNLLSDYLVKMDMGTMSASLEARSPLLDHRIAEFVTSLPPSTRMRHGTRKALLRAAYRGVLPEEVLAGRKRGFEVPLRAWFEGELRGFVEDMLCAPGARIAQYLDPRWVAGIARHEIAHRNWDNVVYLLLALELWLRERGRAA